MSARPKALVLAEEIETRVFFSREKAAAELRRLFSLAEDQHTEIYGLRLQVLNMKQVNESLLEALKYARRMAKPKDCDIGFLDAAIAKGEQK